MAAASLRIGIDTGGTFTDIVCVDTPPGAVSVTKSAEHAGQSRARPCRGVTKILGDVGSTEDSIVGLAHGTTVATNALLQGSIDSLVYADRHHRFPACARDRASGGAGRLRQFLFLGSRKGRCHSN